MDKKKISVVIPCYNEENSVLEMYERLTATFQKVPQYDYEIIFADDCSPDDTWSRIEAVCARDRLVKGIHNATNFGPIRNIVQGLRRGTGDATFLLMGDLQDPPEKLLDFLNYWEQGHQAVIGIRSNTEDRGLMHFFRSSYYTLMSKISNNKIIPNFSYYGLYSRKIIDVLRSMEDMQPFFPGIVAEYAGNIKLVEVPQEKSRRGKSGQGFLKKYDQAMVALTAYTKLLMRLATFVSAVVGLLGIAFSLYVLCMKLIFWDSYPLGIPTIIIGIFFLGAVQLFFLGIMGEYILSINQRSMGRPLTTTDRLLNFEEGQDE